MWSLIFFFCCSSTTIFAATATPVVDLTYAQYQGVPTLDPVNNETITRFLGIRYAAAPTGKDSFESHLFICLSIHYTKKNRIPEIQRTSTSFVYTRRSTSE